LLRQVLNQLNEAASFDVSFPFVKVNHVHDF